MDYIPLGNGGCSRIRTYDPLIKSQLLYQLSYTPIHAAFGDQRRGAEHTELRQRCKRLFQGQIVARRDLTGAVDFTYLEGFAAGDQHVVAEVLALFRQQAALWSGLLNPQEEGWRDAVHTIKGAALGVGAHQLARACGTAEAQGASALDGVRDALDAALLDVASYEHEQLLKSLKSDR